MTAIAPGELVYSNEHWKIFRQDAGMGEVDYAIFLMDEFFCRTNENRYAIIIVRACGNYMRLP